MPRLVIFDCDGVLVDSEPISCRCTAAALTRQGYPIDAAGVLDRFLGISTASMLRMVEEDLGRPLAPGILDDLRREILTAFEAELRAIDGIAETVPRLEGPVCVASSSNPERIRRSLEITGLLPLFHPHIFSATMVSRGKPEPDLFLFAADRMGVPPDGCIVVEDSRAGIRAARAAGMRVLGFAGGSHLRGRGVEKAMIAVGATLVFDRMADLPEVIRDLDTQAS
jgi:HAD superfamily hydrolase (TIGR01509 family)